MTVKIFTPSLSPLPSEAKKSQLIGLLKLAASRL